ncbi:MORN repeat-containing protein 3 [Merluccius polli]|uniref:MORN repeat-containing protein 3 n=1 Tax=Merluccius polli TaxID=89951 RepID=A0AA47M3R3_MERPO|nr:MORN repeat-containing protein 3 [Merluccius polli]
MEKLRLPAITGATQIRRVPPVTQGFRDMKAQNYLEPRSPKHTKPAPVTQGVRGMKAPNLRRTLYSVNGDAYTGEWLEKQKHGKGKQVCHKTGSIYEGDWRFGRFHGNGTMSRLCTETNKYIRLYSGQWKYGKHHGYGTYFHEDLAIYKGEWSGGQKSGFGTMSYNNGDIYQGAWLHGKPHGLGLLLLGKSKLFKSNGNRYEGSWQDGKKKGHGKLFFPDKGQIYEGFWVDGECKCGTLSDGGRHLAPRPTKYPFPKVELLDSQLVLKDAQSAFKNIGVIQGSGFEDNRIGWLLPYFFFQKLTASQLGPGVEEVSGVEEGCWAGEGPGAEERPARGGNSAGVGDRLEGRVVEWGDDDDDATAAWSLGGEPGAMVETLEMGEPGLWGESVRLYRRLIRHINVFNGILLICETRKRETLEPSNCIQAVDSQWTQRSIERRYIAVPLSMDPAETREDTLY